MPSEGVPGRLLRRLTRRGFLGRASMVALVSYADLAGAPSVAAYARQTQPRHIELDPLVCGVVCTILSCTGCGCGGNLYHCVGCGRDDIACITGHACTTFCYPPC